MTNVRFLDFALLVSLLAACGDATGSGSGGDNDDSSSGSGGDDRANDDDDDDGDGGSGGSRDFTEGEPSAACERYVACVAATSPTVLEQISEAYGPDGDCWSDEDLAAACSMGCTDGLAALQRTFPDEERCRACDLDADCNDPERARCDQGTCVGCLQDADCAGSPGGPACVDSICAPDPTPGCVADALELLTGDPAFVECVMAQCEAEALAIFTTGVCAGVDPCGNQIGCLDQLTEESPVIQCAVDVCDD